MERWLRSNLSWNYAIFMGWKMTTRKKGSCEGTLTQTNMSKVKYSISAKQRPRKRGCFVWKLSFLTFRAISVSDKDVFLWPLPTVSSISFAILQLFVWFFWKDWQSRNIEWILSVQDLAHSWTNEAVHNTREGQNSGSFRRIRYWRLQFLNHLFHLFWDLSILFVANSEDPLVGQGNVHSDVM